MSAIEASDKWDEEDAIEIVPYLIPELERMAPRRNPGNEIQEPDSPQRTF